MMYLFITMCLHGSAPLYSNTLCSMRFSSRNTKGNTIENNDCNNSAHSSNNCRNCPLLRIIRSSSCTILLSHIPCKVNLTVWLRSKYKFKTKVSLEKYFTILITTSGYSIEKLQLLIYSYACMYYSSEELPLNYLSDSLLVNIRPSYISLRYSIKQSLFEVVGMAVPKYTQIG